MADSTTTDPKETGEEVKKDDIVQVAEEEKPVDETKEDVEKETEKNENDDDVPSEDKGEVKEEATPEDSTVTNDETTEGLKDKTTTDEPAVSSTPSTSNATESEPPMDTGSSEDKNKTTEDLIKKLVKAEDTTTKSTEETDADADSSASKPSDATETKKEDAGVKADANADDAMAIEPKSELVAAAEEDAKNNKDQPAPCESAVRPNNRDVLFGRGKPFQNHPGNRKMLSYIDQYKRQYNESPRDQKRPIVEEIIGVLMSGGGRFLRRYNEDVNSTWWTEVPKQVAFDKVSHAFRSRGRPKASDSAAAKASLAQARAAAVAVAHQQGHPHQQHPHHPQHPGAYAAHHQGQYGGVPPPGTQFGGQFGQYGMPPGQFNPMIAAMQQQQHHHNPMMGYHPMPGGITAQQQAMMQAGMMVAMQQQQQQHAGSPPGSPPPNPYYQQGPPPPNPYYGQQPQHHPQQPPQQQQHQPQQQQQQQQQQQPTHQEQQNQAHQQAQQQQQQQQQHLQPAPGQAVAPGFPPTMYGGVNQAQAAGIAGGFLLPPQQQHQQPIGAPGYPPPGSVGALPPAVQAPDNGGALAPPPMATQGSPSKVKEVTI